MLAASSLAVLSGQGASRAYVPDSDPLVRQRLARIETMIEAMRLTGLRFLTRQLRGEEVGAETSVNKLLRAELEVEIGRLS